MREAVDAERAGSCLKAIGKRLRQPTTVYITGGGSAVLEGWRESTLDLDLAFDPDGEAYGVLGAIKNELKMNIEFASPDQFLPELSGWRERSPFITREGVVTFRHYDFYAQALAKIERGFARDALDVEAMVRRGLVDPAELSRHAESMRSELIRFPAIDPDSFYRSVAEFIERMRIEGTTGSQETQ
jgi:hypothetical protein